MQSEIKFIDGGVTAATGFTANGVLSHIKASRKTNDTALIYSEKMCSLPCSDFFQNTQCRYFLCTQFSRQVCVPCF